MAFSTQADTVTFILRQIYKKTYFQTCYFILNTELNKQLSLCHWRILCNRIMRIEIFL